MITTDAATISTVPLIGKSNRFRPIMSARMRNVRPNAQTAAKIIRNLDIRSLKVMRFMFVSPQSYTPAPSSEGIGLR